MKKYEFMRVLLLLMFIAVSNLSYASPILKGKVYKEGMSVSSEAVGISFTIPEGFSGKYDSGSKSFILRKVDGKRDSELISIYAFSKVDLKHITNYAAETFAESGGYKLMPSSSKKTGRGYKFQTSAINRQGSFKLICESRKGTFGNGVVVFGLGNEDNPTFLDNTLNRILKTIKWSKPVVNNLRKKIAGNCYQYAGFNQHTRRKEDLKLDLCDNGNFVIVKAYNALSGSNAGETFSGKWELVNDLEEDTYLMLNGRNFEFCSVKIKDRKIDFCDRTYKYKDTAVCK